MGAIVPVWRASATFSSGAKEDYSSAVRIDATSTTFGVCRTATSSTRDMS